MIDVPFSCYFLAIVWLFFVIWTACSFAIETMRRQIPLKVRLPLALLILPAFTFFGFLVWKTEIVKSDARASVRAQIQSITAGEFTLTVNGKKTSARHVILNSILKMGAADANHSGPERQSTFTVHIAGADEELTLILMQDRRDKNEFWVFWNGYSTSREIDDSISRVSSRRVHELLNGGVE